MAVSRRQAVSPRRWFVTAVLPLLQVLILGGSLLTPVPLLSAAFGGGPVSSEEHEEVKPVSRQKRAKHQRSTASCRESAAFLTVAALRHHRIHWVDSAQHLSNVRPLGHRLANGLLAPLTC